MLSWITKWYFQGKTNLSDNARKQAYAALSNGMSIFLNLLLCTAKLITGAASHSVAVVADGFNNLSDAGVTLIVLLGLRVARYGRGRQHPFGHGRFEWIMGIFTSLAVVLMGTQLARTSFQAMTTPQPPIYRPETAAVLTLSVAVKGYMYLYNRRFAQKTDSETLKATAADCISDAAATFMVLLSMLVSRLSGWQVDGFCGLLVSGFILFTGRNVKTKLRKICKSLKKFLNPQKQGVPFTADTLFFSYPVQRFFRLAR